MNPVIKAGHGPAFVSLDGGRYQAGELTRGPWDPKHQHAGPPSALICREIERAAHEHGLTHLARLTVNLLRPVPIDLLELELHEDYVGRNAGHYSGCLRAHDKVLARFTALVQRETDLPVPAGTPGHPLPELARAAADCPVTHMPFFSAQTGYPDLVELRQLHGELAKGPCAVWFRLRHALVDDEAPSPYQRVAVAADSGNGISAALDFSKYVFVNSDLTINLLRRARGPWICLDARSQFGGNGCGLSESALFDEAGLIGRATQSLSVRARA